MNARRFGVLLFVSILHDFTDVGIAREREKETTIWSAMLPVAPQSVVGERRPSCTIINTGEKAISGEIAMFSPGISGNLFLGSAGFTLLEPERSAGILSAGGSIPNISRFFCRVTFDGKRGDVKGSLTWFTEDNIPLFTITFE